MKGLVLHCGGQLASREEAFAVPLPQETDSYRPLPYESLVTRVEKQLLVEGVAIKDERLALAKNGQRLFGLMELRMPSAPYRDYGCVLGLRNSYDKSCSTGLCIGATVFVCDNLSFRGGSVTFQRRHTVNLMRDLTWIITETVGKLALEFAAQANAFEAYRRTKVSDSEAHDLAIRLYDRGAVNGSDIAKLVEEWREPRHPEFLEDGKSLWRLFNAATETAKGNLWQLPARTSAIQNVLDAACGLEQSPPTETASQLPEPEPVEHLAAV